MKNIDVFPNWEEGGELIVKGNCTALEAFNLAKEEYPEEMEEYTISSVHLIEMSKCLDCESYWVDGAGQCGECGEMRLSKRVVKGWHIY